MFIMKLSNSWIITVQLFEKLWLLNVVEIILIPEPNVAKFVWDEEHIRLHEICDDVDTLRLFSILEHILHVLFHGFKVDEVKLDIEHLTCSRCCFVHVFEKLRRNLSWFSVKHDVVIFRIKQRSQIFFWFNFFEIFSIVYRILFRSWLDLFFFFTFNLLMLS